MFFNNDSKIYTIDTPSLREAVAIAFKEHNKFSCTNNSELVDIKDRFRIFKNCGKIYIVKKVQKEKILNEFNNSIIAKQKVSSLNISSVTIAIVTPEILEIDSSYYLTSEYMGQTLHEYIYNDKKFPLSKNVIFNILERFLSVGIVHTGFLPRNIIYKDNKLFFIDWEDALFFDTKVDNFLDYISKAEFLNNWGYFFDKKYLIKRLKLLSPILSNEFKKGSFEREYISLTGFSKKSELLKPEIDDIIIRAEGTIKVPKNYKYIIPSDLGHLISDTFPRSMDVLHDLILYVLQKDKILLKRYLKLMTKIYTFYFEEKKNNINLSKGCLLIPILFTIDNIICKCDKRIFYSKNLEKQILVLSKMISNVGILRYYLDNDIIKNKKNITKILSKIIKKNFIQFSNQDLDFENCIDIITHYSNELDFSNQ